MTDTSYHDELENEGENADQHMKSGNNPFPESPIPKESPKEDNQDSDNAVDILSERITEIFADEEKDISTTIKRLKGKVISVLTVSSVESRSQGKDNRWIGRILWGLLFALVGAGLGVILEPSLSQWVRPQIPTTAIPSGKNIHILDQLGTRMNTIQIQDVASFAEVADIDADGENEIVIGTKEGGENPGNVIIVDMNGTYEKRYDTYDRSVIETAKAGISGHFVISQLSISQLFKTDRKYIIAIGRDVKWFHSHIIIIDPIEDRIIEDHWHAGQITNMIFADINSDPYTELIMTGYNNAYGHEKIYDLAAKAVPVAFALCPDKMTGQIYPGSYDNIGRVEPLFYNVILPIDVNLRLGIEDHDSDGIKDVRVEADNGVYYYFDSKGGIIDIIVGDHWVLKHNSEYGVPFPEMIIVENNACKRVPVGLADNVMGGWAAASREIRSGIDDYCNGDFAGTISHMNEAARLCGPLENVTELWKLRAEREGDYGFLGVELSHTAGIPIITGLISGNGAEKAGLRVNDKITSIDRRPIESIIEVGIEISKRDPGDTVVIQIERRKQTDEDRTAFDYPECTLRLGQARDIEYFRNMLFAKGII